MRTVRCSVCPGGLSAQEGAIHPPCGQNTWHTLVKTLPSFADGKNRSNGTKTQMQRIGYVPILYINVVAR